MGTRKTSARIADDVSKTHSDGIETGVSIGSGMSLAGCPLTGQVVSGVEVT